MSVDIKEGDCIEIMKTMPAGSIDAVVTDPPYGINFKRPKDRKNQFEDIDNDADFDMKWQVSWMKACKRLLKEDRHIYVFCSEQHVGEFREAIVEAGFNLKRMLIWRKGVDRISHDGEKVSDSGYHGLGDMTGAYMTTTELILHAAKGKRDLQRGPKENVINVEGLRKMKYHPTEKPTGILRELILDGTKEGEVVLDPFGGSGSTGQAAKEENREAILIELNPKYIQAEEARLAQEGLF